MTKKDRKIIFITETCFYPVYQGDSARIFAVIEYFKKNDWYVAVLHFHDKNQAHANYFQMSKICDELVVYYPSKADLDRRKESILDAWCPDGFINQAAAIVKNISPQIMFIQFVFFSACFNSVNKSADILKILDADNIFTNRAEVYRSANLNYDWFSTDKNQEREGLLRADIVLAIQEEEQQQFQKWVPERPVLLLPHVIDAMPYKSPPKNILLFIGAANPENYKGINNFISEILPELIGVHPQLKLRLVGKICHMLHEVPSYVELLGVIDDVKEVYLNATIVLNTTDIGTGLKIKTVEALCYGKCLVSTPAGVAGLEKHQNIYHVAGQNQEYIEIINQLLLDYSLIEATGIRAHQFAKSYFNPQSRFGDLENFINNFLPKLKIRHESNANK